MKNNRSPKELSVNSIRELSGGYHEYKSVTDFIIFIMSPIFDIFLFPIAIRGNT